MKKISQILAIVFLLFAFAACRDDDIKLNGRDTASDTEIGDTESNTEIETNTDTESDTEAVNESNTALVTDECDSEDESAENGMTARKPVIYLYPESEMLVSVKLALRGELTCTYPLYNGGWKVTASPDGTLTDEKGMTYNYLYWEGIQRCDYDLDRGFCIAGKNTAVFLEDALQKLGLNRREANEFIVYWLPIMERNPYNLITFQSDAYTESAVLDITPAPDTLIRVFMVWKGLDAPIDIEPQELSEPTRQGFTAVEWGGSEIN